MGSKFKPEVNQNPGPGQYSVDSQLTQKNSVQVRLGSAARKDIWDGKDDMPGPGKYAE